MDQDHSNLFEEAQVVDTMTRRVDRATRGGEFRLGAKSEEGVLDVQTAMAQGWRQDRRQRRKLGELRFGLV
jgi:hypothetical protein